MKVDGRSVEALLREPGAIRAVLFYGSDAGLVRDRAVALTRRIAGAPDDPFRVVELTRDRLADLTHALAADSLIGGRRVIRLRDATDQFAEAVGRALKSPGRGFLIMEAGELQGRSKLRMLLEAASDGAAVACVPADGSARGEAIKALLQESGIAADTEAMAWLMTNLGADRGIMRGDIERLALAMGGQGIASSAVVRANIGDQAGLSLDDALFSALAGNVAAMDRALTMAAAEGATAVQVVRSAAMHFQRLHVAALAVARGSSPSDAARGLRPPVFYQRLPVFVQAVSRWPAATIAKALAQLSDAERMCKRSGVPADTVARMSLLSLAQRGAVLSNRSQRS